MATSNAELILDALPWGVLLVDRDRRIRFASARAAALLDATPDALVGESVEAACRFDVRDELLADVDAAFAGNAAPDGGGRIAGHAGSERRDVLRLLARSTADPERVAIWIEALGSFEDEQRRGVALERCLRIASQVRHDVNNSLMGVFGHADMIAIDANANERIRERAQAVLTEAQKLRDRLQPLQTVRRDEA